MSGLREENSGFWRKPCGRGAEELGVKVLGKMPLDPKLASVVEEEKFYEVTNDYLKDAAEVLIS